jgi:hypothetical protein
LQNSDQEFGAQKIVRKLEHLENGFDIGFSSMEIKAMEFHRDQNL